MRTIPLYLMALIVAIANTPLDIFQFNQRNVGTLKVEPWRSKRSAFPIVHRLATFLRRIAEWFQALGGLPAIATVAALVLLAHLAPDTRGVMGAIALGLNGYRQRAADLKGEIAKATKERASIGEAALKENRAMTPDEKTKFVAFGPTIETLDARLAENAELLQTAERANEADRAHLAGRVQLDADAAVAAEAARVAGLNVPRVQVAEAKISPARMAAIVGRGMQAVRNFAIKQNTEDDQKALNAMANPHNVSGAPTGMNSDVPSEGGFTIAPEWSSSIIQRAYDVGALLGLVGKQPIGPTSNGISLPAVDETSRADGSRFGGIVSGWLGQGNTLTTGKPKFRLMNLKLRKVGAFLYGTDELLADNVALGAWIDRYLPQELAFRVEDAIFNGDGENKPAGALNSGAIVNVTRNTSARVLYEDVSSMWKRIWAPLRKNSIWQVDQSVEQELEQLSIAIGTAGVLAPIYKPAGLMVGPDGTQGYSPATLYGRPILTTEYNAALGTVGDIVLWAPQEYTLISKGEVEQAVSLHVAFLTDEAVYRFMYRVDGQMNWSAVLTPKNGGNTLAPIVTLT